MFEFWKVAQAKKLALKSLDRLQGELKHAVRRDTADYPRYMALDEEFQCETKLAQSSSDRLEDQSSQLASSQNRVPFWQLSQADVTAWKTIDRRASNAREQLHTAAWWFSQGLKLPMPKTTYAVAVDVLFPVDEEVIVTEQVVRLASGRVLLRHPDLR